jgi:hypothetical protein
MGESYSVRGENICPIPSHPTSPRITLFLVMSGMIEVLSETSSCDDSYVLLLNCDTV